MQQRPSDNMFKGTPRLRYFLILSAAVLITGLIGSTIKFQSHFSKILSLTGKVQRSFYGDTAVIDQPFQKGKVHRLEYGQYWLLAPRRPDVLTITPWLAPIVWEGTFEPEIIDNMYKPLNLTIATTVFAVGKYTRFLRDFLETAEQHYMVGFRVHYYVFTDQPKQVPAVTLAPGRKLSVIQVPKFNRWQEISLRRMEIIQTAIEERIRKEADYIYCLDVDMRFHNRWGPEVLDTLVAAIHPWFYTLDREQFTYERRPASKAYVPKDQGDFYYMAAVFGGRIEDVHKLTKTCRENLEEDKKNNLEAAWQEESHLNRYLVYKKPTKLLSPEYMWDDLKGHKPSEIRLIRFSAIIKNKAEVRENI
ncbi:globoside alpha-1,3-N-acetylgalactosaminyltransferase 1-like isoform X2 [Anguilla anguilla]|uniref:globoside alpha-1,3-N-acetylgalactosaminyltransferase 1-like isoform X2 n=1 Tax=Anguilla anguilla TaxID=7936 RepID=UPI0015B0C630|nr:globoside alpha-1,3-N-acetylgalactosaminyltransferase 1-like isoform X2 [Anguilla anguilla]